LLALQNLAAAAANRLPIKPGKSGPNQSLKNYSSRAVAGFPWSCRYVNKWNEKIGKLLTEGAHNHAESAPKLTQNIGQNSQNCLTFRLILVQYSY
jgi:hypothetical protein